MVASKTIYVFLFIVHCKSLSYVAGEDIESRHIRRIAETQGPLCVRGMQCIRPQQNQNTRRQTFEYNNKNVVRFPEYKRDSFIPPEDERSSSGIEFTSNFPDIKHGEEGYKLDQEPNRGTGKIKFIPPKITDDQNSEDLKIDSNGEDSSVSRIDDDKSSIMKTQEINIDLKRIPNKRQIEDEVKTGADSQSIPKSQIDIQTSQKQPLIEEVDNFNSKIPEVDGNTKLKSYDEMGKQELKINNDNSYSIPEIKETGFHTSIISGYRSEEHSSDIGPHGRYVANEGGAINNPENIRTDRYNGGSPGISEEHRRPFRAGRHHYRPVRIRGENFNRNTKVAANDEYMSEMDGNSDTDRNPIPDDVHKPDVVNNNRYGTKPNTDDGENIKQFAENKNDFVPARSDKNRYQQNIKPTEVPQNTGSNYKPSSIRDDRYNQNTKAISQDGYNIGSNGNIENNRNPIDSERHNSGPFVRGNGGYNQNAVRTRPSGYNSGYIDNDTKNRWPIPGHAYNSKPYEEDDSAYNSDSNKDDQPNRKIISEVGHDSSHPVVEDKKHDLKTEELDGIKTESKSYIEFNGSPVNIQPRPSVNGPSVNNKDSLNLDISEIRANDDKQGPRGTSLDRNPSGGSYGTGNGNQEGRYNENPKDTEENPYAIIPGQSDKKEYVSETNDEANNKELPKREDKTIKIDLGGYYEPKDYDEKYDGGNKPKSESNSCICVPYYQCEDGHIVTDGAGIIDARKRPQPGDDDLPSDRQGNPGDCGAYHVCCSAPETSTVKPYEHRCGTRNPSGVHSRVLSPASKGEADFGEWPWQAAILKAEGKVNIFMCGGVLIDNFHVITVAHCVFHLNEHRNAGRYPLKVRLGEWDTQTTSEFLAHRDFEVADIKVHPDFRNASLWNDIAILRLREEVQFAPHIDTICLPRSDDVFNGHNCVVTGWGKDAYVGGSFSNIMKEVVLEVLDDDKCEEMLRKTRLGRFYQLHEGFLCAGGEHGVDSCKGDGGGPLVCYRKDMTYALAGIVSWGIDCGQPGVPGVYVEIQKYMDWISKSTGGIIIK